MSPTQKPHVFARWSSVLAMSIVGAATWILIAPLVGRILATLEDVYGKLQIPAACGLALLTLAMFRTARGRFGAFFGMRHFYSYPPVWVAALVATEAALVICGRFPSARGSFGLDAVPSEVLANISYGGLVASGLVLVAAHAWKKSIEPLHSVASPEEPAHENPGSLADFSFDQLVAWFENDDPVNHPTRDLLEHRHIARRIAARLTSEGARRTTTAVLGALGCGKTTVRMLTEHYLSLSRARVRIVPVGLWPYETGDAAVSAVLAELTRALGEEVPVASLRGISRDYLVAIESVGGPFGSLARLASVPGPPEDVLKRFDLIAAAIGYKFVLWVEDLERFAAIGTAEASSRLRPIKAVLYLLDQLSSVSVVLASTTWHLHFDANKLVRFEERIPGLSTVSVTAILRSFRTGCMNLLRGIDPADPAVRSELDEGWRDERLQARLMFGSFERSPSISEALPILCESPRMLKSALRRCYERWEALNGEIDFDDVLAMSILEQAESEVYSLVVERLDDLRGGVDGERRQKFRQAFADDLARKAHSVRGAAAAQAVVDYVFPKEDPGRVIRKPQGIGRVVHRDYWPRFATAVATDDEFDQPVIAVCNADDDNAIAALLEDPERHVVAEVFSQHLSDARLRHILEIIVGHRLHEVPRDWVDYPPGLVPTWRLFRRQLERGRLETGKLRELVERLAEEAIVSNLQLASEMEHWFSLTDGTPSLIDDSSDAEASENLRARVAASLRERYEGDVQRLADALAPCKPWTLLRVCWGIREVRNRTKEEPFPGWPSFANTILEAAAEHPSAVLPQLAPFFVAERMHRVGSTVVYNQEAAEALFGRDRIMEVFGGAEIPDSFQTDAYRAVREAVRLVDA